MELVQICFLWLFAILNTLTSDIKLDLQAIMNILNFYDKQTFQLVDYEHNIL